MKKTFEEEIAEAHIIWRKELTKQIEKRDNYLLRAREAEFGILHWLKLLHPVGSYVEHVTLGKKQAGYVSLYATNGADPSLFLVESKEDVEKPFSPGIHTHVYLKNITR